VPPGALLRTWQPPRTTSLTCIASTPSLASHARRSAAGCNPCRWVVSRCASLTPSTQLRVGMTDLTAIAWDTFGWSELRPGQPEAMDALVAGRDVLAVLPTGAGKSAIYQVPALVLAGPTIVVSPLVALQQDQQDSVRDVGEGAVQVNASVGAARRDAALDAAGDATAEFVFVTPEQLADEQVLRRLAHGQPSLIAVDEAHCVSAWGHDFRPDYLSLGRAIEALGHPPVAALTATAAPPVRDDIIAQLGLRDPLVLVRGLDRPNIELDVRTLADEAARSDAAVELVHVLPAPGIIYAGTRRGVEQLAAEVAAGVPGVRVAVYHAGLPARRRVEVHEAFMQGDVDVVVATNAFGMGIDKADVRFVLHATTPDSPDSYLQEFGRGGRDGEAAWAVLLHRSEDLALRRFLSGGLPSEERLVLVARAVQDAPGAPRDRLLEATGLGRVGLARAVALLEQVAGIRRDRRGRAFPGRVDPAEAGSLARKQAERHQRVVRSRIEAMRQYVATNRCRRQFLLGWLGEQLAEACGSCDTCRTDPARTSEETVRADSDIGPTSRVAHPRWGHGTVIDEDPVTVTVLFDEFGFRTLKRDLVASRGLLLPLAVASDEAQTR
jgi:ATP-dependent DNA helicase RecQ